MLVVLSLACIAAAAACALVRLVVARLVGPGTSSAPVRRASPSPRTVRRTASASHVRPLPPSCHRLAPARALQGHEQDPSVRALPALASAQRDELTVPLARSFSKSPSPRKQSASPAPALDQYSYDVECADGRSKTTVSAKYGSAAETGPCDELAALSLEDGSSFSCELLGARVTHGPDLAAGVGAVRVSGPASRLHQGCRRQNGKSSPFSKSAAPACATYSTSSCS